MNLELKNIFGLLASRMDAFFDGGCILTLLHRHDVRVGIATGMYIRRHWSVSASLRLEILCVLHLCYWRWSTKMLLEEMEQRVDEYAVVQPLAREQMWKEVWAIMEAEMAEKQVASWATTKEVKLMSRAEVKEVRRLGAYMNLSSRRTAS